MGIISYAQNFEDVLLWRALGNVEQGFYIDIGAQDPIVDSVSYAFYLKGWRGVHIEPSTQYASKLRDARPDEIVIESAVSSQDGLIDFYNLWDGGLSTARSDIAKDHEQNSGLKFSKTKVTAISLDNILNEYKNRDIHWLKIDVEGYEAPVLEGWKTSEARPWIVVIESTYPNTSTDTSNQWEDLISKKGYSLALFDGLNKYYVSDKHRQLLEHFSTPVNVFDDFQVSGTSTSYSRFLTAKIDEQLRYKDQEIQAINEHLLTKDHELQALWKEHSRKKDEMMQYIIDTKEPIKINDVSEQAGMLSTHLQAQLEIVEHLLKTLYDSNKVLPEISQQYQHTLTKLLNDAQVERKELLASVVSKSQTLDQDLNRIAQILERKRNLLDRTQELLDSQTSEANQLLVKANTRIKKAAKKLTRKHHEIEFTRAEGVEKTKELVGKLSDKVEQINIDIECILSEISYLKSVAEQTREAPSALSSSLHTLLGKVEHLDNKNLSLSIAAETQMCELKSTINDINKKLFERDHSTTSNLQDIERLIRSLTLECEVSKVTHNNFDSGDIIEAPNHKILWPKNIYELTPQQFIKNVYWDFLYREPDPSGWERYSGLLRSGHGRANVASDISMSLEAISKREMHDYANNSNEEFLKTAYSRLLGRSPDPAGFKHYLNKLSEQKSRSRILKDIKNSPEHAAYLQKENTRRRSINELINTRPYSIFKRLFGLSSNTRLLNIILETQSESFSASSVATSLRVSHSQLPEVAANYTPQETTYDNFESVPTYPKNLKEFLSVAPESTSVELLNLLKEHAPNILECEIFHSRGRG